MNAPWMKAAAVSVLAAATGVLAPACADNESSLFIRACLVPDDQCVRASRLENVADLMSRVCRLDRLGEPPRA